VADASSSDPRTNQRRHLIWRHVSPLLTSPLHIAFIGSGRRFRRWRRAQRPRSIRPLAWPRDRAPRDGWLASRVRAAV